VTAVPHIALSAVPYPGRLDGEGDPVYDSTYVNWVPDPGLVVTGYRVTQFTAAGARSVDLPRTAVRYVAPVASAGFTVTARTTRGAVTSAPVWSSIEDTGEPPAVQVAAPEQLRTRWTESGALSVSWRNPDRNTRRADRWSVSVDDARLRGNERPGRVPSAVVIPASELPSGDLRVGVVVGSTRDRTDAEAVATRSARYPITGRAVAAGPGRYRLYLDVAPSWSRRACSAVRCPGTALTLRVSGRPYTTWVDSTGGATATVAGPAGVRRLEVAVTAVDRGRRVLDMPYGGRPALSLPVARG
jgi:hypothetical protein